MFFPLSWYYGCMEKFIQWLRIVFITVTLVAIPFIATWLWLFIEKIFPLVKPSVYIAVMSTIGMIGTVWFFYYCKRRHVLSSGDYKLIAKSQQFLSLYRHSPVPYITIDKESKIIMHNLSAMRLFQTDQESLGNQQFDSFIRHEDETELSFILGKLKNQVTVKETEVQIVTMRGEMRWVLLSVFASENSNERLVSLVDITHQKTVDLAKSEFVALATHQLRTPITAIRWNTELLAKTMEESKTEKQTHYLEKIERNIQRMLALINDFLSVSKLETGTFATDLSKVNLPEFINTVIDEYTEAIEQKQLRLELNFEPINFEFESDPRLLHIIISNLISNAVKYTVNEGQILINYKLENGRLLLEVADSGIGIPEEEMDQLFNKFFRASNAQNYRTEGTGLGIYIVKQSVEKLGGTVTPYSVLNEGTRFEVRLPIH